jgi:hypothetical protein
MVTGVIQEELTKAVQTIPSSQTTNSHIPELPIRRSSADGGKKTDSTTVFTKRDQFMTKAI